MQHRFGLLCARYYHSGAIVLHYVEGQQGGQVPLVNVLVLQVQLVSCRSPTLVEFLTIYLPPVLLEAMVLMR
jgi:hypothetical protein